MIEYRALTLDDYHHASELWARSEGLGPVDSASAYARFLTRNPGLSRAATRGERLVGAILCGHDGRRGFVYRLAVAPELRKQGIATELARGAFHALRAEGIARCQVFILADNDGARAFWSKLGAYERRDLMLMSLDF